MSKLALSGGAPARGRASHSGEREREATGLHR